MAITFPVAAPTVGGIRSMRFIMLDAVGMGESPYDFSQEVFEHAGKRWAIEVQLVPLVGRAIGEPWAAFLAKLRGRRGTFQLGDPVGATARGIATGTPLVKGASQTGGTLLTDGWTINKTGIMKEGDWVQIGTELHKVLQDTNSDGSGNSTLELWPGPRVAPADNAAITVTNTKGLWRLAENERGFNLEIAQIFGITFNAIEAL